MLSRLGKKRSFLHQAGVFAAGIAILCSTSGCLNQIVTLGYLIGGPPTIEPDFEKATKECMTDYKVTVAVVCYAPTELQWDYEEIQHDIAKFVSLRLLSKHIQAVNPDRVRAWLDQNDTWDKPEEIGAALGVTYVIYIDLNTFNLCDEKVQDLYWAHADAVVSVTKMNEDKTGEKIYSKELTSKYPLAGPRSTTEVSFESFKKEYLSWLSEEIGWLFYEHSNGDAFGATL